MNVLCCKYSVFSIKPRTGNKIISIRNMIYSAYRLSSLSLYALRQRYETITTSRHTCSNSLARTCPNAH